MTTITDMDIPYRRLLNQHMTSTVFGKPEEMVAWLGAVQAQDYGGAEWALGLRLPGVVDEDIERAFTAGTILRTHVMRPTWHFVTPADIRWLLALTAPRVHALNTYYYRKLELDQATFTRTNNALVKALESGQALTRDELRSVLQQAGIPTEGELRMSYVMMRAELDGVVCSGPRRGKQFTYMLLEERVPSVSPLVREEALAELVRRYFTSHGPATVKDFVWWSGLTTADTQNGLEMVKSELVQEKVDGRTYWFSPATLPANRPSQAAFLLPNYDEYFISYRDHSAVFNMANLSKLLYPHMILVDGRIVGTWKRTLKKRTAIIETNAFVPLTAVQHEAITEAAQQYGAFLKLSVELLRNEK